MKLLYVITSSDVGGAEQALSSLLQAVAPHNTVKVVCLKPLGALAQQWRSSGAEVVSLEMSGAGLGCVSQLVTHITSFQPDIVHAMLFRAIEFARLACAGRNLKLVTTPHFDLSKKPAWMRWLDRMLCKLDTRSVAESASTYKQLLDVQHYPPSQTLFIGNSVKKSLFFKDNSLKTSMRQTNGFSAQDVIFISVARLAPVKNPKGLLTAFARILPQCPQAKLVFVGNGILRAELAALIKTQHLEKAVFLMGEQTNINAWLNMADAFVLVSKEESLPLALLEAQQVGLPCLVSNVGDMPKQIEHGKNGFVSNYKDETLITCLLAELYENKTLREQMGQTSLQKMATVQDSSQQYQQLYQQLLSK